jgi:cytochrome c oxidase subunit IV
VVRLAAALWWAGALAAVTGLVAMLLDRAALDARLTATATAEDPTASADLVADGVRALVLTVVASVGLLVLLSLGWLALVLKRRSWARWALLVTLLPALAALAVAQSVAAGDADLDRVALVAAAVLFLLAVLALFLRPARRWFRAP